jgi:hypothetical protein
MTSLNLSENAALGAEKETGFWMRQFQLEPTREQKHFDAIFGVFLPVACFFFDPLVFRDTFDGAMLGAYKPFAYLLSYVSVLGMIGFLLLGAKLKWFGAVLSGLFFLAAVISLAIGIVIFPYSLMGMVFLIGVLGFVPLVTSFVFLRNAVRAFESAGLSLERGVARHTAMLSLVLSFCLPYLANVQIANSLKEMVNDDAQTIRIVSARLRYAAPVIDFNTVKEAGRNTSLLDGERKRALADAYHDLTGRNINGRRWD